MRINFSKEYKKEGNEKMPKTKMLNGRLKLPRSIINKLNLTEGEEVLIDISPDNKLVVKPLSGRKEIEELKKLVFHLGKVYDINREAIYDEID